MKNLFLLSVSIFACILLQGQNVIKVNDVRYQIFDDYAEITRQDPDLSGDIVIPEKIEYNGKEYVVRSMSGPSNTASYGGMSSISAEGATFQGCSITSISLPPTITYISTAAFINCADLVTVTLPETLTSIGWGSFAYCSNLENINIPNAVTNISAWAFGSCRKLKSISIPSGVTSLPNAVFKNCGFEEFTIPDNIKSMGEACLNMSSLKTVKSYIRDITSVSYRETCFGNVSDIDLLVPIGSKDIYIEYYPWRGFKSITEFDDGHVGEPINPVSPIIRYNGIRYQILDDYAEITRQDPDLSGDIVIPEKIEYNGKEYVVRSMSGPSNTASYGGMSSISAEGATFQGCSITSISLPPTITYISTAAFINCADLVTVTLPETLTSIGWGSFAYCSNLENINIPNAVTNISAWAFGSCRKLKSISIPSGVTSLPNAVFKNCGFEEFTIPDNIKSMGEACLNMSSLKTVKSYIRDITSVSYRETCFGNVSDIDLLVPIGSKDIYIEYYPWRGFKSITEFDDGHVGEPINPVSPIIRYNGIRYQILDDYAEITRQDPDLSGDIVIPEKIEYNGKEYVVRSMSGPSNTASYGGMSSISAEGATFQGCSITSIPLPPTITYISTAAFINCADLVTVTLPETLTSIGWGSFAYCSNLENINIPNAVTNISAWAFGSCRKLKSISIPSGVTSLPNAVFKNCGFEEFTIPDNIKSMGEACLNMSSLKTVKSYIRDITSVSYRETCFGNVSDIDLLVPIGSKDIYIEYYPWRGFKSITEFDESYDIIYIVDSEEYKRISVHYGSVINPEPAPTKEGYAFSGWSEIPETMPAHDVTVTGTFTINSYKLTYLVDGEVYKTYDIEYSATITPEAEPTKEGYTFSGWSEIPETMPAQDVTVIGTFSINSYKLTYTVDGEVYKTYEIEYGATITPEAEPTKEGYTFSGWSEIPETMPAHDVTVTGTFAINSYKLTYTVDGEVYKSYDLEYGAAITPIVEPTKEGYTFSGWSEIPETMPAHDVTVTGTFAVNSYKLTYIVDGEVYKTYDIEYGSTITPEAEPTKEGYTFSGWSEIPATMPAHDVTVTGSFSINSYKLTYTVDGEVYKTYDIEYGATITPEAEPTKEGYTFSGWSTIPETMPAHDVTITGTFIINKYKLTYIVDGEVYKSYDVEYGATITPEAEPTKEGYTFSGWSEIPATMPAHDVTVTGTFSINKYKLTYTVDGEVYKSYEIEFGASITPETEPSKEGYTFSGWSTIPEAMPAHDVTVTGSFKVNKYKVNYFVDNNPYYTDMVEYGATITPPSVQEREGYDFAWGYIPDTMPAYDISIYGQYTVKTGIITITTEHPVDIYNLQGNKVRSGVTTLEGLAKGIYIVNGRKIVVK